ncbi:MAG: hypothetical protein V1928_04040 [Parcubacteria group bacterium]
MWVKIKLSRLFKKEAKRPKFIIKNCVSRTQRIGECVCNKFLGAILDFTELSAIRDKALAAYDEQGKALDISALFSQDATIILKKAGSGARIFRPKDFLPIK